MRPFSFTCAVALAWLSACTHVVVPPAAHLEIVPRALQEPLSVRLDVRTPRSGRVGSHVDGLARAEQFSYQVEGLKAAIAGRVAQAAEAFGLAPSGSASLVLDGEFPVFEVTTAGPFAGGGAVARVGGSMKLARQSGEVLFAAPVAGSGTRPKGNDPALVFEVFDAAVASWFTALKARGESDPALAEAFHVRSGASVAAASVPPPPPLPAPAADSGPPALPPPPPSAGATSALAPAPPRPPDAPIATSAGAVPPQRLAPRAEEPSGAANLELAQKSRSLRIGRVLLSPIVGFAFGIASNLAITAGMNAACGNSASPLTVPSGGCGLATSLLGLTGYIFIVPLGVTWSSSWLSGQGSYGSALIGSSIGASVPLLYGFAYGTMGLGNIMAAIFAPITSMLFYELTSAGRERSLELSGGVALIPSIAPRFEGKQITGLDLHLQLARW